MNTSHAPAVCFYFQVHQPFRLKDLRFTDIGGGSKPFDDEKNRAIFRKVAEKCYLPANAVLLQMLDEHPEFHASFSLSGVFLDQCELYGPDVLASFQALAKTGRVEFLAETYYHSLSAVASPREFASQVKKHSEKIMALFGMTPKTFRNTELIYSNEIAQLARLMGFETILAEGVDRILDGRQPNVPYAVPRFRLPRHFERAIATERPLEKRADEIHVLLKHYRLSDDIAFRFSDSHRSGNPLLAETFASWVKATGGHSVNLFMDYETFGEHQWADTGIFAFLAALPAAFKREGMRMRTPSQLMAEWKEAGHEAPVYDAHALTSWADTERDLSAWQGNHIQRSALTAIYALEDAVKASGDAELLDTWRKLQTSDHYYYMCTKYWHDGDVHKYFSPYDSPYEAYRRFSHALEDLRHRLRAYEARSTKHEGNLNTPVSHISNIGGFEDSSFLRASNSEIHPS